MSDDSLRITGPDKRQAPRLMIEFVCEAKDCGVVRVMDAYEGPPTCGGWIKGDRIHGRLRQPVERHLHTPAFMKAVRIVEGT